jgi:O-antigen ligase
MADDSVLVVTNRSSSFWPQQKFEWLVVSFLLGWWGWIWLWGVSGWQLAVCAGGVSFCWLFFTTIWRKSGQWQPNWFVHTPVWYAWWLWLVVVGISTVTSQIWPVSWWQWEWWLTCLVWFWWAGSVQPKFLLRRILITTLLLGTVSLILASLGMIWFRPLWLLHLPTINFLFSNFGHNHLAALIIIVWPLIWQQLFSASQSEKKWWMGLVGLLSIGLVISFSRLGLAIAVIELGILIWRFRVGLPKSVFWLAGGLTGLLAMGFGLKQLLTMISKTSFSWLQSSLCYQWWAPNSVCLATPEPRIAYWQQALLIWREWPVFGGGPGTFGLLARRWMEMIAAQSVYAHSVWFQVLAETGLVGLLTWITLVVVTGWGVWRTLRAEPRLFSVGLALAGSLVMSSLDFDWQLSGVFLPLLALTATLLPEMATARVSPRFDSWIRKSLVGLVLISGMVSGLIGASVARHQVDVWLKYWPGLAEWYGEIPQAVTDQTIWLEHISRFASWHPDLISTGLSQTKSPSERLWWVSRLEQTDPWRYWQSDPLSVALEAKDWNKANQMADALADWLLVKKPDWRADTNLRLSAQLFQLAKHELQAKHPARAGEIIQLAQIFEPWVLQLNPPLLTEAEVTSVGSASAVLAAFNSIDHARYGENLPTYQQVYRSLWAQRLTELEMQLTELLNGQIATELDLPFFHHPHQKLAGKETAVLTWVEEVEMLSEQILTAVPEKTGWPAALAHRQAELLLAAGNLQVGMERYQTAKDYRQAQIFEPWVLNGRLWWFELTSLKVEDPVETLRFADTWQAVTGDLSGNNPAAWQRFFTLAIQLATERNDTERITKYTQLLNESQSVTQ